MCTATDCYSAAHKLSIGLKSKNSLQHGGHWILLMHAASGGWGGARDKVREPEGGVRDKVRVTCFC